MRATLILILLCVTAIPATAEKDVHELSYQIWIRGVHAGNSDFVMTEQADAIIIESHTQVEYGEFGIELDLKTEYDRDGLTPRFVEIIGIKNGVELECTMWLEGDSIKGHMQRDGDHFPMGKRVNTPIIFFEDYAPEHLLIMFRTLAAQESPYMRFERFGPSDFSTVKSTGAIESEIEMPTVPDPSVCAKYVVSLANGGTFYGYLRLSDGVPVYLDFPSAGTEMFLIGAWPEITTTKYAEPPPGN